MKKVFTVLFRSRCSLCLSAMSMRHEDLSLHTICTSCLHTLNKTVAEEHTRCTLCLAEITTEGEYICLHCLPEKYEWNSIRALVPYQSTFQSILTQYKYQNKLSYIPILSHYLCSLINKNCATTQYDYILPIPLYNKKLRERGFHQIWELIKHKKNIYPIYNNILLSRKRHSAQMSLTLGKRIDNVSDIFITKKKLHHASVLLIDDVITTGLTTHAAAHSIKEAGAKIVDCIALCHNNTINKEALLLFTNKEKHRISDTT
ncbi:MAG: ComF family protein [Desulfovibrionaceae bacterium]